jgi:hypothetical protein
MEKLVEYINTLDLTVTKEMVERHDEEYATFKSGYSNRANLDSEYLEDMVIENVEGAERVEGKDRYFADIKYKGKYLSLPSTLSAPSTFSITISSRYSESRLARFEYPLLNVAYSSSCLSTISFVTVKSKVFIYSTNFSISLLLL